MDFKENEIVMLLLGIGVLIFVLIRKEQLKLLPAAHILIACFGILVGGWSATVLEGFFASSSFYYKLCNSLEHLCYAASAILIAYWSWRAFVFGKET